MTKNVKIEAEGNELILRNSAGDHVIIPKKYRREVEDMIKEGCFGCIDNLVSTLPVMDNYAEDGTIIEGDGDKQKPTSGKTHILVEAPLVDYMESDKYYPDFYNYVDKKYFGSNPDEVRNRLTKEYESENTSEERRQEIDNYYYAYNDFVLNEVTLEKYNAYLKENGLRPFVPGHNRNEFFYREAERFKKNLPDVNVTYTYNDAPTVDSVFQSVQPNDKIVIMGHAGGKTLGISNKDIATSMRKNIKNKEGVECLLGGCNSSSLLDDYKYAEVPVHGYTGEAWYVPYDKGNDLKEMMFGWKYEYDENNGTRKIKKVPASEMMKTVAPF